MPRENKELIEILDSEFDRIRAELGEAGKDRFMTLSDMAEFLDTDAGLLSRYRLGERLVSRRSAHRFAEQLRRNQEDRKLLIDKLLGARPPQSDDEIQVESWFDQRGHKGFLMIVSFHEPPVLKTRTGLVEKVAHAIANGLCYAIVFPFSLSDLDDQSLPRPIQTYLGDVWRDVQRLYEKLLIQTLEDSACIRKEVSGDTGGEEALRQELKEAAGRIQVFKVKDIAKNAACNCGRMPAIGFRLFYCRDLDDSSGGPRELWQWNSALGADTMLQRRAEAFELDAVESLLYPIPQQFEHLAPESKEGVWALPTNENLEEFYLIDRPTINTRKAPKVLRWEVADVEGIDVNQLIDKTILRHPIRTGLQLGGLK